MGLSHSWCDNSRRKRFHLVLKVSFGVCLQHLCIVLSCCFGCCCSLPLNPNCQVIFCHNFYLYILLLDFETESLGLLGVGMCWNKIRPDVPKLLTSRAVHCHCGFLHHQVSLPHLEHHRTPAVEEAIHTYFFTLLPQLSRTLASLYNNKSGSSPLNTSKSNFLNFQFPLLYPLSWLLKLKGSSSSLLSLGSLWSWLNSWCPPWPYDLDPSISNNLICTSRSWARILLVPFCFFDNLPWPYALVPFFSNNLICPSRSWEKILLVASCFFDILPSNAAICSDKESLIFSRSCSFCSNLFWSVVLPIETFKLIPGCNRLEFRPRFSPRWEYKYTDQNVKEDQNPTVRNEQIESATNSLCYSFLFHALTRQLAHLIIRKLAHKITNITTKTEHKLTTQNRQVSLMFLYSYFFSCKL